jgi:hypothetical protein
MSPIENLAFLGFIKYKLCIFKKKINKKNVNI